MQGPLSPAPAGRGGPEGLPPGSPLGEAERWEAFSQPGASHKAPGRPPGHPARSRGAMRA